MSDVPEDLDLSQLGKTPGVATPPPVVTPAIDGAGGTTAPVAPTVVMQSPAVPYPVAAPLNPGDPVPTLNHYPWTPLPLAPVETAPVPKLDLPPAATPPTPAPAAPAVRPALSVAPSPPVVAPPPDPAPAAVTPSLAPGPDPAELEVKAPAEEPQKPVLPPDVPRSDIKHIYSFSTQEVWRALRPSKAYGLFLLSCIAGIALLAFVLVQTSGVSVYEIPFIKDTLGL